MNEPKNVPEGFEPFDQGTGFGAGFGPVYVDQANCRLGFFVTALHLNPFGACHGGAMATFADMQVVAIKGRNRGGRVHSPTISLSIDYLAPVLAGNWVQAEVMLAKTTSTMLFTQALISADGSLVARSSAIYRYYPRG
ncbi:MAG: PaaI family thioesterase [Rudaea sp.]|uniref:PaaI family thioesterase n=1 Tax=Rudaea sp. TaxID=2136325 RepID=UPI0039E2C06A